MAFTVHLKRQAFSDIGVLFLYVKERSGSTSANSWRDALLRRIESLQDDALVWSLSEDADFAAMGYRELLFRRSRFVYRIIYRIAGNEVFVHRVRSASQDNLSADKL